MNAKKGSWIHRHSYGAPPPPTPSGDDESAPVDAAEAWKAVGLVNEWVRHAEGKAATTLAAAGVIGGVLYNLVADETDFGLTLEIAVPVAAGLAITAAVLAVVALWPRLLSREPATSSLYFEHIARRHPKSSDAYVQELKELIADPAELLDQLGQQVWANARVARRKYRWAGWALVAVMAAAFALAIVAIRLALDSIGVWNG